MKRRNARIVWFIICILPICICSGQTKLEYSTFIGGNLSEYVTGCVLDSEENLIIVGTTKSNDFPLTKNRIFDKMSCDTLTNVEGLLKNNNACLDIFILKIDLDKNKVLFSTIFGGSSWDSSNGIAIDENDNLYISGNTHSTDFPITENVFQKKPKGFAGSVHGEHFITKIDMKLYKIVYSTYLGGSESDMSLRITCDKFGNAIVAGSTYSPDYPTTPNAFDTSYNGEMDGVIAKINSDGSKLIFSSYFGGSGGAGRTEGINDVKVDDKGNIYITGSSSSIDFPISSDAYDGTYNGGSSTARRGGNAGDCFFTIINSTGSKILYSTYIGGSHSDKGSQILLDDKSNVYISGTTKSIDFPVTKNVLQSNHKGSTDIFITKWNLENKQLEVSTLLGGENYDEGYIATTKNGDIILYGYTKSNDLQTTTDAYNTVIRETNTKSILFLLQLNTNLSATEFLTYFGGNGDDSCGNDMPSLLTDKDNCVIIVGVTRSSDFPITKLNISKNIIGEKDIFISKISNQKF